MKNKPIVIERKDDKMIFVHLGDGMYKTLWGVINKSISRTPLEAFSEELFNFYYDETIKST